MADSVSLEFKGLAELAARMRKLPQEAQAKVLRGAVAAGAAVIKNEAIQRAPLYTGTVANGHPPAGTLKGAIYQMRATDLCGATREVQLISVRRGRKAKDGMDAYYAGWVEYGTVKMTARPYMRPALETKREPAIEAMRAYIASHLPAVWKGMT